MKEVADERSRDLRAKLAVLDAMAQDSTLWRDYVLKGGFALHYVYGSPRGSEDLDFTAVRPFSSEITEEKNELLLGFCSLLDAAMAGVAARYGFQSLRFCWKELSKEIPCCLARIGYAEEKVRGDGFEDVIETQITLSEVIGETVRAEVEGLPLHVPSLEDIVAEKLKALVQQVRRQTGGGRPNDVYDVWYFTTQADYDLDPAKVTEYLLMKSAKWDSILPMTKAKFRDPAVRAFSRTGFEALQDELRDAPPFPSYDEAFDAVLALAETLNLPEK